MAINARQGDADMGGSDLEGIGERGADGWGRRDVRPAPKPFGRGRCPTEVTANLPPPAFTRDPTC